ncbi:hypothetical protein IKF26_02735 [Candidatus Saccharibacteria bacterium]|nr:hypothetical protein [Candidatus Saccharibacteria bacterium]
MDGNTANNVVGDVSNDVVSGGVIDGVGGNVAGASDGGKKRLGNGPLIAILAVLLVVIVGLGVGVGINYFGSNGKSTDEVEAERIDEVVKHGNFEVLQVELSGVSDVGEVTEIYQKYIDVADTTIKAELLIERARWVMGNDGEKQYSEQVFGDLIMADDILLGVDSAVNVINAAIFYDDGDLFETYSEILNIRSVEDDVDIDMETVG